MQQRLDRHLNPAEVAVADALQELAEAGAQRPTVGLMAQRLGIEPSRASRMTAGAIHAGLVRRIASQTDGRSSHLELTPEGSKALEKIQRFRMRFFAQLMSEWSDQECAEFGRLLIRFTDLLPSGFGNEAMKQKHTRSNPQQTRGVL